MDFSRPLSGVEVSRRKGQDHPINWQELHTRTLALVVKPQLKILRATQRQLSQQLLLLVAELLDLLSNLPVQEVLLALCNLRLEIIHLAQDLGLDWAVRREKLFNRSSSKVHTTFGHSRVNDLGSAHEGRATGSVITHASTTDALLILLVTQFSSLLISLQKIQIP